MVATLWKKWCTLSTGEKKISLTLPHVDQEVFSPPPQKMFTIHYYNTIFSDSLCKAAMKSDLKMSKWKK